MEVIGRKGRRTPAATIAQMFPRLEEAVMRKAVFPYWTTGKRPKGNSRAEGFPQALRETVRADCGRVKSVTTSFPHSGGE